MLTYGKKILKKENTIIIGGGGGIHHTEPEHLTKFVKKQLSSSDAECAGVILL